MVKSHYVKMKIAGIRKWFGYFIVQMSPYRDRLCQPDLQLTERALELGLRAADDHGDLLT